MPQRSVSTRRSSDTNTSTARASTRKKKCLFSSMHFLVVRLDCRFQKCTSSRGPVVVTARQHNPCDPSQLVRHGYDQNVTGRPRLQSVHPGADQRAFSFQPQYRSSGTVNEHLSQVWVSSLAVAMSPRVNAALGVRTHDVTVGRYRGAPLHCRYFP
jgi:hypothetical protein